MLTELAAALPGLHVITAEQNRGHGPTALAAYRAGLELEPDLLCMSTVMASSTAPTSRDS